MRSRVALTTLLLLAGASGCGPDAPEPTGPERVVLELFALSADPGEDDLLRLFGPESDGRRRAVLADSVELLRPAREPRIVGLEEIEGPRRVVIDVEAGLDGGGAGLWSVQVDTVADGWRVTWFQGPGVEWPPARQRRDDGLSTSPAVP